MPDASCILRRCALVVKCRGQVLQYDTG